MTKFNWLIFAKNCPRAFLVICNIWRCLLCRLVLLLSLSYVVNNLCHRPCRSGNSKLCWWILESRIIMQIVKWFTQLLKRCGCVEVHWPALWFIDPLRGLIFERRSNILATILQPEIVARAHCYKYLGDLTPFIIIIIFSFNVQSDIQNVYK